MILYLLRTIARSYLVQINWSQRPDYSKLVIRTDNGFQHISTQFDIDVKVYGVRQGFMHYHTPEQNGHVESFHKSLKKEYTWP